MKERELKKYSLLSEVAGEYYDLGMSEEEISRQLCISRTRISRLLTEARKKGIVKISINNELDRIYILQDRLKERYNLTDVRVLNNRGKKADDIGKGVEKLAAEYIWDCLKKGMVIGTSWGTTLSNVVQQIHYVPFPVSIVQLMGSVPCRYPSHTPQGVVSDLAHQLNGSGSFLNVPLYVKDDLVRKALLEDANNRRVANQGRFSDMVLTSVGNMHTIHEKDFWKQYLTEDLLLEVVEKGAVGSILGRFYDVHGQEINCLWNKRLVTPTIQQIIDIPNVVVIAYGEGKSDALEGALSGGLINSLVVDGSTAATILSFQTLKQQPLYK